MVNDLIPVALAEALQAPDDLAVAISGGVDSVTLAHAAHLARSGRVSMFHAVSPAVPVEATARVRRHAEAQSWDMHILDAGEFADPDYLRNPVNRCYFCKSNLYDRIGAATQATIASGANLDDLGDFRPGLKAAKERRVIHPFVTASMPKSAIRELARSFGLTDVAELPAQPCLASRIETGLRVTPKDLAFVADVERALTELLGPDDLRCRVVAEGVRIELDLERAERMCLSDAAYQVARTACDAQGRTLLALANYRRGSAFLHGV